MKFKDQYKHLFLCLFISYTYLDFSETNPCEKNEFNCLNGSCLINTKLCDGTKDCDDGSDEMHCGMYMTHVCYVT